MRKMLLPAAAFTVAAALRTDTPAARPAVPFIEDDYARALSEARGKKVPLFVENWAPW